MPKKAKPLFWVDLEMTGLDEKVDSILEAAVIISDVDFNVLEEYATVVFQPDAVLEQMNDWCKKAHKKSGLTCEVPKGKPLKKVEEELLALLEKHYKKGARVVLIGNSVGNDRRFIDKYMPKLAARLHYRILDVSSFKELFREKYGIEYKKKNGHRALGDIKESMEELKYYLQYVQISAAKGKNVKE